MTTSLEIQVSGDVITINGKRYAAALFGPQGFLAPPGTLLRIEEGPDDVVTCTTVENPHEPG